MATSKTFVRKVNTIGCECKWCHEHSANVEITVIFPGNSYQNRSTFYHAECLVESGRINMIDDPGINNEVHWFGITRDQVQSAWDRMVDND